jgi:hypothetical protein
MTDKQKYHVQKEERKAEPFFRHLKPIEKPMALRSRALRDTDIRLFHDLTDMSLQYEQGMGLMNDIVNYNWPRARKRCVQQLDLIMDRMTNTNLERLALVKGKAMIEEVKADETESTMRPSYEKATKKFESHVLWC